MTIVEWPKEKNNPQVTGNWPIPMRPRVALSIALSIQSNPIILIGALYAPDMIRIEGWDERTRPSVVHIIKYLAGLIYRVWDRSSWQIKLSDSEWSRSVAKHTQAKRAKLRTDSLCVCLPKSKPATIQHTAFTNSSHVIRSNERPNNVSRILDHVIVMAVWG